MEPSGHYSEPFGEALSHSSQRVTQLTSLVAAAAEVAIRLKAARAARQAPQDEQARRVLDEQERTARAQARARWAPAHDARWLAQADLLQAAGTWGAAAPWASTDPAAASAMRKSEERLRTLHPFAMARYDRLCSEGASPLDAMREAAPLFGLHPRAHPAPTRSPLAIDAPVADAAPEPGITAGTSRQPGPELDPYQDAERRGRRIAERLQAQALYGRGAELSPDELATALEQASSLPAEVIARLARAREEERVAEGAERAPRHRPRARLSGSIRPRTHPGPDRRAPRHPGRRHSRRTRLIRPHRSPTGGRELPTYRSRRHPRRPHGPTPAAGTATSPHRRSHGNQEPRPVPLR